MPGEHNAPPALHCGLVFPLTCAGNPLNCYDFFLFSRFPRARRRGLLAVESFSSGQEIQESVTFASRARQRDASTSPACMPAITLCMRLSSTIATVQRENP